MSALADENRRNILMKLKEGKFNSGELSTALNLSPQALSYHLKKLKRANLIYESKYKNFIYYELDLTILNELVMWISELTRKSKKEEEDDEK